MVEVGPAEDLAGPTRHSCLGVGCAKNDLSKPCVKDRPGAHETRLQGNEETRTWKSVVSRALAGCSQRLNFRMGAGVIEANRLVPAQGEQLSLGGDHHGAHGHLPLLGSPMRLLKGQLHPVFVGHSHSIVAGGLELMSNVTRFIPRTSLMMRDETRLSSE